jgi:hypothetical protein
MPVNYYGFRVPDLDVMLYKNSCAGQAHHFISTCDLCILMRADTNTAEMTNAEQASKADM